MFIRKGDSHCNFRSLYKKAKNVFTLNILHIMQICFKLWHFMKIKQCKHLWFIYIYHFFDTFKFPLPFQKPHKRNNRLLQEILLWGRFQHYCTLETNLSLTRTPKHKISQKGVKIRRRKCPFYSRTPLCINIMQHFINHNVLADTKGFSVLCKWSHDNISRCLYVYKMSGLTVFMSMYCVWNLGKQHTLHIMHSWYILHFAIKFFLY